MLHRVSGFFRSSQRSKQQLQVSAVVEVPQVRHVFENECLGPRGVQQPSHLEAEQATSRLVGHAGASLEAAGVLSVDHVAEGKWLAGEASSENIMRRHVRGIEGRDVADAVGSTK